MLCDAASDPSTRVVLVSRPEGDIGITELVSRVKCLNISPPCRFSLEVGTLPHVLEEESLISEQARNDWGGDSNVCDVLDGGVTPKSSAIRGNILRHHSEESGTLGDLLQLLVERHLLSTHKLAILRPHPPNFLVWLEPKVEWEIYSGVYLLPIGFPASEFRQTYGSNLSGCLDELGPNGVLEAVVAEVGNDRAEVIGKEVEAVTRVETCVRQQVDRCASIDQELNS